MHRTSGSKKKSMSSNCEPKCVYNIKEWNKAGPNLSIKLEIMRDIEMLVFENGLVPGWVSDLKGALYPWQRRFFRDVR